MAIASMLSDLWRGGGAFEAPPSSPGPGTPKKPRRNRVKCFIDVFEINSPSIVTHNTVNVLYM